MQISRDADGASGTHPTLVTAIARRAARGPFGGDAGQRAVGEGRLSDPIGGVEVSGDQLLPSHLQPFERQVAQLEQHVQLQVFVDASDGARRASRTTLLGDSR